MNSLNGFEFAALTMLSFAAVVIFLAVVWLCAVVNKRLANENRDLLKAVLALSPTPHGAPLAAAMESTDHADVQGEHATNRARQDGRAAVRMRAAGSG